MIEEHAREDKSIWHSKLERQLTKQNREVFLEKVKQMKPSVQPRRPSQCSCLHQGAQVISNRGTLPLLGNLEIKAWARRGTKRSRSGKYRDWYCVNKLQLLFSFLPESNQGTKFHNQRGCLFPYRESRASLVRRERSPLTKVPTIGSTFLPCA